MRGEGVRDGHCGVEQLRVSGRVGDEDVTVGRLGRFVRLDDVDTVPSPVATELRW